ncbi:MAG: dephospho-CoA kinase [Betaproteobacteria bacterium]|nr:MAG: dephospho-CoA kinase [Betaproteobacteria bacterium]
MAGLESAGPDCRAVIARRCRDRYLPGRFQGTRSPGSARVRSVSRHRRRDRTFLRQAADLSLSSRIRIVVPYVVGLTGGIGSGKSEVANAFAGMGVEIVDADALSHRLSAPGEAGHAAIIESFGHDVSTPSGEIDRVRLRRLVFADAKARARLEALLHPLIRAEAQRQIGGWRGPYGIAVVPLLIERGGLADIIDVVARSAMSPEEVRAIMATQVDRSRRLAAADDILDNSGAKHDIGALVRDLDVRYRRLATQPLQSH